MPSEWEDRQRVSCAGLCRVRNGDGEYLLGLNANRLAHGRQVYTALGGGLRYTDPTILTRFRAVPEEPGSNDLRLFLEPDHLPAFRAWFQTRLERETSVFRELHEELVDEFAVLTRLTPNDCDIRLVYTFEALSETGRHGAIGITSAYFHEVFDVDFAPDIWAVLLALPPDSGLRWFSESAIRAGHGAGDVAVDATVLLGPAATARQHSD